MSLFSNHVITRPADPRTARWIRTGLRSVGVLAWLLLALFYWITLFGS